MLITHCALWKAFVNIMKENPKKENIMKAEKDLALKMLPLLKKKP